MDGELVEAITGGTAVALHAARASDRMAILDAEHGDRTFGELSAHANQLVRALRRRGVRAGDGVALMCNNRAEFAETWAAAWQGGYRITTLNWHLGGDEAGYIVNDCEAKALIVAVSYGDSARDALPLAPGATARLAIGGDIDGFDSYDDALAEEDPSPIDAPELGTFMLYTSGTTGRSKGVHRAEHDRKAAVDGIAAYAYRNGNVHLCTGPMYHAAPLTISMTIPLQAGVPVVVMDHWDEEETLRLIDEHRVTHTHMVATMFHRLLALPEAVRTKYDLSSLIAVLHGAAPCPVEVKRRMIEWFGPVLVEYYAATEGGGTLVDSTTWLSRPGTVGQATPGNHVKVADEDASELPRGEVGLVWMRAPKRARFEYFKDDTKTGSAYRGDYFTLGDMGYMDGDGFLFLTDRSANLIISGGVNIYPAEVDAVLLTHPAVADAATIGVPNDEWGEEVKAVVQLKDGVTASGALVAELLELCRAELAHFKCPRSIDFAATLPREDSGKIFKHRLRAEYRDRYEAER